MSGTEGSSNEQDFPQISRPDRLSVRHGAAFALAGAIALGADVAMMYVNWQQTQKVADAAALAGANYLSGITYTGTVDPTCTGQPDTASEVACTYAVKNGLAASTLTITEPTTTTLKVVATNSGLPYFFAKALPVKHGDSPLSTYTVMASATSGEEERFKPLTDQSPLELIWGCAARTSMHHSMSYRQLCSRSVRYVRSEISRVRIDLPGNWGWLDLDGSGGSGLESDLANGATTAYSAINSDGTCSGPGSCTVYTDTGAKIGPVKKGLDCKVCRLPKPSLTPAVRRRAQTLSRLAIPCLVVVPAVDFAAATKAGKTNLTIETFAEVYLEPTGPNATTPPHIGGCYVSAVAGGTLSSTTTTTTSTTEFVGATAPPTLTN